LQILKMTMIEVPFDRPGIDPKQHDSTAIISEILDNAYGSLEWFKYLSDNATLVKLLSCTYSGSGGMSALMTTYVFGFVLPAKKETFYRMKYGDGR
jgi:hypothetical protein